MVVQMVYHTWLRRQDQRQPQRALPQQGRFEAQAQPQLAQQRLERELPVPGLRYSHWNSCLCGRSFIYQLSFPATEHFTDFSYKFA